MKLRALSLSLVSIAMLAGVASAQPRRAPVAPKVERACNMSALPLSVGNQWTYESVPPPPDRQLSDAQLKQLPVAPKKIVIKVAKLEAKDGTTTVTLSEDHDGRVHESTVSCRPGGADVRLSPNGFWFAGEPGTSFGVELADVERKGHTFEMLAGKLAGLEWHDDLIGKWKHVPTGKAQPTLRSGTVQVLRHFVVLEPEDINTLAGQWKKAAKLGVETTIKVTIDPAPPLPLRETPLLVNFLYQADNVGVIQVVNSFGQAYVLTSFTVQ